MYASGILYNKIQIFFLKCVDTFKNFIVKFYVISTNLMMVDYITEVYKGSFKIDSAWLKLNKLLKILIQCDIL